MAGATGTLRENDTTRASSCRGFADHVWHVDLSDGDSQAQLPGM